MKDTRDTDDLLEELKDVKKELEMEKQKHAALTEELSVVTAQRDDLFIKLQMVAKVLQ